MENSQPLENYLNKGLSFDELVEIKQAFDNFDVDKCGEMDPDELKQSLLELESNQIIESMIKYINENALSTIDFGTFLDIMMYNLDSSEKSEDLLKMFNYFQEDDDQSKEINIEKIAKKMFHEKITQEELENIVKNTEGKINFEKFEEFMTNNTSSSS